MRKQIKYRPSSLKVAEDDYVRAMARREFVIVLAVLAVGALVVVGIIAMAKEALVLVS